MPYQGVDEGNSSDGKIDWTAPPSGADYLSAFMSVFEYAHYNTPFYSWATGSYVQGGFPVIHSNETGANGIPGIEIYNHTGMDVSISLVNVDTSSGYTDKPLTIPNDNFGRITFSPPIISPNRNISIQVNFTVGNFGYGQLNYNGPIYPAGP